jgi:hypothetical protein
MARRIGFYSIRKAAASICKFITRYKAGLAVLFDDKPALIAALEAANAACAVLVEEIDKEYVTGL